mmetsp:Transcript_4293/g.17100  ORF Transcript_4293/g.17100 Transcript_4293/m.17100 type:complete len:262 (+) Transcript_4293:1455-2240(+)
MRSVFCFVCSTRCGVCAHSAYRMPVCAKRRAAHAPATSSALELIRAANSTRFSSGNAREMPARSTFSNATTSTSARRFFVAAPSLVRRWRLMGRTEPLAVPGSRSLPFSDFKSLPALPRVTNPSLARRLKLGSERTAWASTGDSTVAAFASAGVTRSSVAGDDFAPAGVRRASPSAPPAAGVPPFLVPGMVHESRASRATPSALRGGVRFTRFSVVFASDANLAGARASPSARCARGGSRRPWGGDSADGRARARACRASR